MCYHPSGPGLIDPYLCYHPSGLIDPYMCYHPSGLIDPYMCYHPSGLIDPYLWYHPSGLIDAYVWYHPSGLIAPYLWYHPSGLIDAYMCYHPSTGLIDVEALRGICAKQGCVGRSIQGGVEGGCARQEGHGPWVLRQNPHGAHLEAKDMVWKKGGRDSGDLGHATTLPRQTALMSLIEVQSPRVLSAFFKVVGKRNFSNSKMRFIEPIRNLLSDLFSDN